MYASGGFLSLTRRNDRSICERTEWMWTRGELVSFVSVGWTVTKARTPYPMLFGKVVTNYSRHRRLSHSKWLIRYCLYGKYYLLFVTHKKKRKKKNKGEEKEILHTRLSPICASLRPKHAVRVPLGKILAWGKGNIISSMPMHTSTVHITRADMKY